jgi:hypothetical protein
MALSTNTCTPIDYILPSVLLFVLMVTYNIARDSSKRGDGGLNFISWASVATVISYLLTIYVTTAISQMCYIPPTAAISVLFLFFLLLKYTSYGGYIISDKPAPEEISVEVETPVEKPTVKPKVKLTG